MHSAEHHHHHPHHQTGNGAQQGQELQHMDRCLVEGSVCQSCLLRAPCPEKRAGPTPEMPHPGPNRVNFMITLLL